MKPLAIASALLVMVSAVAGCGGSTATSADDASVWAQRPNTQGVGAAPDQPASLEGWKQLDRWNTVGRAYPSTWAPALSAQGEGFPAGGNTCNGLALVKWRSLSSVTVRSSWRYAGAPGSDDPDAKVTPEGAQSKPAVRGWLILDSCREPLFEADGKDQQDMLTDVTYTVAQYQPIP